MVTKRLTPRSIHLGAVLAVLAFPWIVKVNAQPVTPSMLDDNLAVRPVISGLNSPTSMAFLGDNDFLVLEKATGNVKHVVKGVVVGVALDLAVNNASERGLLGIALHPNFSANHFVYLYSVWVCAAAATLIAHHRPIIRLTQSYCARATQTHRSCRRSSAPGLENCAPPPTRASANNRPCRTRRIHWD